VLSLAPFVFSTELARGEGAAAAMFIRTQCGDAYMTFLDCTCVHSRDIKESLSVASHWYILHTHINILPKEFAIVT